MKLYFAYKETGEFDGFYDDEIHSEIPKNSVEITEELQNELLIGLWFINIEKISEIDRILDVEDKEIFFTEHELDIPEYIDTQKVLLKQIVSNKLELIKKDQIINNLIKQIATNKIEIMKMKGGN
ncbi:hypothetical protein [Clostridium baratii]|uniref:hypothetical protein n=1 Tax=Clostridium baratii TaxID=1561 RepID=UPI0030CA6D0A